MDFDLIKQRALEIRRKYAQYEANKYGQAWSREQLTQGFLKDVQDLLALVKAKETGGDNQDLDQKLQHELADCLWSVIVIADAFGIDLEQAFFKTMDELDHRLEQATR